MTKPEANAALCRELGVKPKSFGWHSGTTDNAFICSSCGESDPEPRLPRAWGLCKGKPAYPDLTSADVLMAVLDAQLIKFNCMQHAAIIWREIEGRVNPRVERGHGETHGSMLFRAACAAFGIEVDA